MSGFKEPTSPRTELSPGTPESDCGSSETEIYTFSLATSTATNTNISFLPESPSREGFIEAVSFDGIATGIGGTRDPPGGLAAGIAALAPPMTPPRRTVKQKMDDIRAHSLLLRSAVKEIEKRLLQEKKFELSFDHGKVDAVATHEKQVRKGLGGLKLVTQVRAEPEKKDLCSAALDHSAPESKLDTSFYKRSTVLRSPPLPIDKPLPVSNTYSVPEGSPSLGKVPSLLSSPPKTAGSVPNVEPRAIDIRGRDRQAIHENTNECLGRLEASLPVDQNVDRGASSKSEKESASIPPHLRGLNVTRTMPLEKGTIVLPPCPQVHIRPTPPPPTIIDVSPKVPGPTTNYAVIPKPVGRASNPPPPTKVDGTEFKLPENPHIGGYDQRAVLKDAQKVDVRGLKFTAWPEAINRGDRIIQENRAVIIDVPLTPTLSMISLICKNTGKLESISVDFIKGKAVVTFIDARHADQFWRRAMKPLNFVTTNDEQAITSKQQIMVRMDWPVNQLSQKIRDRLWTESASRMIFLGGWEKKNLENMVGKPGEIDTALEILLERLAEKYVPGGAQGRVEKVTWKDKGWGFFEGDILYAGIHEAMAAFDALKVEHEFKGCDIKFEMDPCEPPVTVRW